MGVFSMQQHYGHQQQQATATTPAQHSRPSSIVHQQHQSAPQQGVQHSSYPPPHSVYSHQSSAQHNQDLPYYQSTPYTTAGVTSGYQSADNSEMMSTMPRPTYPPISYHTPQSNSPASVASNVGHDPQRSMYQQPHMSHQSMYYQQQSPYGSMPTQTAPSPYSQHSQAPHPSMTSQPQMMMSHTAPHHPMAQHTSQHAQAGAIGSPRHPKIESQPMPSQLQRSNAPPQQQQQQVGPSPGSQNGNALSTPTGSNSGMNPNAAPGPIPATTPLVVRQDGNGVQWIAFEYSRDRVKMEYTIRCDVESVNTEELSADFKQENCVYPRACCAKDQYRGNRLQYETECNTVGWALAELNASLRGKRGLIQRAVDSWRNSNQDPRLRSRRVRRMAKMNTRKSVNSSHPAPHMAGPGGAAGMPGAPQMSAGGAGSMGKAGMPGMGAPMHHSGTDGHGHGEEVEDSSYMSEGHSHHHHQQGGSNQSGSGDVRQSQVFSGYGSYSGHPSGHAGMSSSSIHDSIAGGSHLGGGQHHSIAARSTNDHSIPDDTPGDLFPDIPEAKKRKFILVEDSERSNRLRVRVTLQGVKTHEIPDSFRRTASVYPRSFFAREMQSPPPSATGSRFFQDDDDDLAEDDGSVETEGAGISRRERKSMMVTVPMPDEAETEVAVPRVRKSQRAKEVRLNDLGYRMAWLQSRVFSGRTVFLQRALDCYRNKTRSAIETSSPEGYRIPPLYDTRVGKRRWNALMNKATEDEPKDEDDA